MSIVDVAASRFTSGSSGREQSDTGSILSVASIMATGIPLFCIQTFEFRIR
jgi:hypothetical protein